MENHFRFPLVRETEGGQTGKRQVRQMQKSPGGGTTGSVWIMAAVARSFWCAFHHCNQLLVCECLNTESVVVTQSVSELLSAVLTCVLECTY